MNSDFGGRPGAPLAGGWLATAWGLLLALALLLPVGAWAQQPLPPGAYGFVPELMGKKTQNDDGNTVDDDEIPF